MTEETKNVGSDTLDNLQKQDEKLSRIEEGKLLFFKFFENFKIFFNAKVGCNPNIVYKVV